MPERTKYLLGASDCAALIVPLSNLRVAIAGAIGCSDFGAHHVEYYCEQLPDNVVFSAARVHLADALADARYWLKSLKRRLGRARRNRTVIGSELDTLISIISRQLEVTEQALTSDTMPLYTARNLAQTAMRLLTGRLQRIAEGYRPEPARTERYEGR